MNKSIVIAPAGRLRLVDDADAQPPLADDHVRRLEEAFGESSADGLLCLVSRTLETELPPALVFWRDLARRVFEGLCQFAGPAENKSPELPPLPDHQFEQLIAAAPPMRGLEYLTAAVLRGLWNELAEMATSRAAKFPGGRESFLQSVNPVWHLLGRVTFHLAENKRDPDRPFAFLATFAHRVSARAKLQHLPLAEAVKQYAEAKEQAKLTSLLEPVRRASESCELVRELLASRSLFQPQAWTIRQAYRLLSEADRIRQAGVVVRLPDWWKARQPPRPQVRVRIGQRPADQLDMDSLLDFHVDLALDGEPLSDDERRQILAATEGLMLLRGKWVEVDRGQLQQVLEHWRQVEQENPDGIGFIQGMRLLAGATLDGNDTIDESTHDWSQLTTGTWLRETLERLRDPNGVSECQPGRDLRATLRPYQVEGVRWLWFLTGLGLGACLADDMGLGKTIQVIDLLLQRRRESSRTKSGDYSLHASLLVVPASLVANWRHELECFAPTLRVLYAHRSECDAETLARLSQNPRRELSSFDIVVTTYNLVRSMECWARVPWRMVVLDEAQAIKNATAAQTRAVKKLDTQTRIVLTGTPVENHLGDLWSIFDFCCPGLLGSAAQFKGFVKRLNQRQDARSFGALRQLVRPYILRRLKTDPAVAPDLPEKTEMHADCVLSRQQATLYEQVVKELEHRLKQAEGMARRGLVLSVLMQLKQICNHPAQYLGSGSYSDKESGKFQRLAELCEPIAERQEKVLVFTQFQSLTDPLAEFLAGVFAQRGLVLHGGTPVAKRKELVRAFQDERGPPFFVVSLKAGGTGLNLTAASHVIHFDRWWNPAVENQATDRAFRIGQKRNVLVHKFVCRGTVEERIDRMIRDKQQLADDILGPGTEASITEMNDKELLRFVSLDLHRATADEC